MRMIQSKNLMDKLLYIDDHLCARLQSGLFSQKF